MIALGVLLLLSPLYVDLLALGEPTYRYERVQVTYDGEVEYRSPGEDSFFPMLDVANVACLPGVLERVSSSSSSWTRRMRPCRRT